MQQLRSFLTFNNGTPQFGWSNGGWAGAIGAQLWQADAVEGQDIYVTNLNCYNLFVVYNESSEPGLAVKGTFNTESTLICGTVISVVPGDGSYIHYIHADCRSGNMLHINRLRKMRNGQNQADDMTSWTLKGIRGIF